MHPVSESEQRERVNAVCTYLDAMGPFEIWLLAEAIARETGRMTEAVAIELTDHYAELRELILPLRDKYRSQRDE